MKQHIKVTDEMVFSLTPLRGDEPAPLTGRDMIRMEDSYGRWATVEVPHVAAVLLKERMGSKVRLTIVVETID